MNTKDYNPVMVVYKAGDSATRSVEFENVNQAREFESSLRDWYGPHGFFSKFIYLEERNDAKSRTIEGPKGAGGAKGSVKRKEVQHKAKEVPGDGLPVAKKAG